MNNISDLQHKKNCYLKSALIAKLKDDKQYKIFARKANELQAIIIMKKHDIF